MQDQAAGIRPSGPDHPWWRGGTIYHVYLRSFADSNGDGIGDLPGLISRLDYIAGLGVDSVWISPFFKSPMDDFGYDISDHCDIDPIFGTMADWDRLVEAAHARGLKLIIDQVYSHTSAQHEWFQQSRQSRDNPHADWYVWHDAKPDGSPPNNWQSIFGGPAWTWDARRRQYYMHNFLSSQPDLNLHHPAVQEAIKQVARFWLERGADGLRLDAANFYTHDRALTDNPVNTDKVAPRRPVEFQRPLHNISQPETLGFIEELRHLVDSYPDRFTVAELGEAPFSMVADYTQPGKRCHSAYNFAFLYQNKLDAALPAQVIGDWMQVAGGAWPSWTFSNHDAPRALSRFADGPETPARAKMLNALLLSLPGTLFLYYGEELGLPQAHIGFEDLVDPEAIANWPHTLGRDGARTPMPWQSNAPHGGFTQGRPWLPVDPRHLALAVDKQQGAEDSTLAVTRALLAIRHQEPALHWGDVAFRDLGPSLVALERSHGNRRLLCLFNLVEAETAFTLPDGTRWQALFTGNGASLGAATLPPFGFLLAEET